jgi:tRNA-specific 2-thiouridylase
MTGRRIVVGMSGGVDSSVAAALLVEQGFEVVGVTLHLAGAGSRCCSLDDADDARRVADALGIRFYVTNQQEAFRREVTLPFADAYLAGRTPLPCVTCNRRFKFGALQARARDQSYFLFDLCQAQLARARFPLGELTKQEVRARARALGLATADKPESQEICFVPDGDYARVVEALRPGAAPGEGEIVDGEGRVLGRHGGIHRFTVGQRRGLGLASAERLYVKRLEPAANRVVVGREEELASGGARLADVSWIGSRPAEPVQATVRIRYRHPGAPARIEPAADGGAAVWFDEPVTALAPGQAAVFYAGDRVLGGGWIAGPLG